MCSQSTPITIMRFTVYTNIKWMPSAFSFTSKAFIPFILNSPCFIRMGCSLLIFIFHLSSEIWGHWTVRRTSKSIIFISTSRISAQNDKEWSDWISCYWNPCRSYLFFNAHSRGKWLSMRQNLHWLSLTLQLHWSRSPHVMMSEGNHHSYSQWDHYNFGIFTEKRTM